MQSPSVKQTDNNLYSSGASLQTETGNADPDRTEILEREPSADKTSTQRTQQQTHNLRRANGVAKPYSRPLVLQDPHGTQAT